MATSPGLRLLLTDDEALNRDMLSRRLARHGYDVLAVPNGPETLAAIERENFAVLLLDVMMPGMSGLEVLRRIRETRTPEQLPIIMVTARAQSEDIVEALDMGANDYVTKPVDFPVMLARIRTQIGRRDADQQLRASHERLALAVESAKAADALTGLPNRGIFADRVERLIDHGRRVPGFGFAVLFLDLDRFKNINDSLGYQVGDRVIVDAAARLEQALREDESGRRPYGPEPEHPRLTDHAIARLGGDEFAVLVTGVRHPGDATRVAERILHTFSEPFEVGGQTVIATVSIGAALSASGYERGEDMLRDADIALERAKGAGRACVELFDAGMRNQVVARLQLETDLRWALSRGELVLDYQPIVALADQTITGLEALVRWRHPQRGLLMPAEFLSLAEDTGLIVPIGYWVMREVCRQLQEWSSADGQLAQLMIAVNLSSQHLQVADIADRLAGIAREFGVDPSRIELELSERCVTGDAETTHAAFEALKAAGFRLTIDDFGSGYASLSSLERFPVDRLKIDRAFLNEAASPAEREAVIRGMIDLVSRLDMEIVAEGIEQPGQLAQLSETRCGFGQGFLIGKPVAAGFVEQMLHEA
ncbi:MAG TPA: EAL domain-containing protein [Vicinamibacterales bacterium]